MKLPQHNIKFALAICLVLCSYTQVQAESINSSTLVQNLRRKLNSPIFAAPPPPKGTGEPEGGKRSTAGSRGCDMGTNKSSEVKKQLTALVPFYSKSELVYGITSEPYPILSVYVPYKSNITYGEFVLEDEAENQQIYKVALTGTPGIINLRLPSKAQPLQIGKQQRWYFNVYCKDDNQIIGNLEGYIKREELKPTLKTQLSKATPKEKVQLYGAGGVWFEALSNAMQVHKSNPRDTSLQKLLQEIGLKDLVNQPIVDCCQLKKD
ncbi:MAG: DUF928 domain-containing protein [Nostocaceae cyanobacterium]|nr:DUF928 domain-containing protein [Nostocaceae cyanobacterium]